MALFSFMDSLSDSSMEKLIFWQSVSYASLGLCMLWRLSIAGRPVAHSDGKLGSKHKKLEAERVEILERLNSGLKLDDAQLKGGADLVLLRADISDVEKEPLCSPLLPNSNKEANVATISLSTSGYYRLPFQAYESMKKISEEAVDDSFICSSDRAMLQSKVELHDGVLERLNDLLKASKPQNKQFTPVGIPVLQVDNWAILQPSDQGVNLLILPVDKVPVILHAEYAAGLLTITGLNLENTDIYVSAENANYTVKLNVWRLLKASGKTRWSKQPWQSFSETEEDIATVPVRLSWTSRKVVFIYATKKVHLGGDGQSVYAVSKAVRVVDSFWQTDWSIHCDLFHDIFQILNLYSEVDVVFSVSAPFGSFVLFKFYSIWDVPDGERVKPDPYIVTYLLNAVFDLWIPTIALWIFTIYYIRAALMMNPYMTGFMQMMSGSPALVAYSSLFAIQILMIKVTKRVGCSRVVEFFKYHIETLIGGLGQGLLVFYYGFRSLKGPQPEFPKQYKLLQPPPPLPSPRFPPPPKDGARELSAEAASVQSVEDPDWQWPAFEELDGRLEGIWLTKYREEVPDKVSPFRVIYIRRKGLLWPDVLRLDLFSCPLIKIVQKFLPRNGDLQCLENPQIKGRDLFLALDGLKNHEVVARDADPLPARSQVGREAGKYEDKGEFHLKHLVRFLEKHFLDVTVSLRRMSEEKRVAWDMLWTFLTPGKKVVYTCDHSQELLAAVVSKNTYVKKAGEWLFSIDLEMWDYDGRSYHKCQISREIQEFDGERGFFSLAVRPIEMVGVPELLDEGFLANGKHFHELAMKSSHRFMHYSGPMFRLKGVKHYTEVVKENADGRVMIDLASFAKMNPGYQMGSAKPPVASCCGAMDPASGRIREQDVEKFSLSTVDTQVSEETLIFAPAIVYGFSFTLKSWGSFAISGFSEISFDTNAFDALVMEPERKQLVYDLVSEYVATPEGPSRALQPVDPISTKGEGCILLCYGPPGTGKTLTAESLAENMHRPLWSLSVSELEEAPNELEQYLFKVMDIAATWRAVLLLDEADVFLEKQNSTQSFTGNATTGVFLRFLEYYRGVMFLTTNRIGTFGYAFRSHISIFLHYPELSIQDKEQVWTTLLVRAGIANATADFISQMAAEDLNGREIRNVIHTAQIWAKRKGQTLRQDHVRYASRVLVSSLRTLSDMMKTSEDEQP